MILALIIILLAAFIYDAEPLLDRWFKKMVIVNCERQPYLHRWYIFKTKRITLFAHKFVRSDEDRAKHDHPWSFLVIPIWRGYFEHSDRIIRTEQSRCIEHFNDGAEITTVSEARVRMPVRNRVLPLLGTRYRGFYYRHRVELMTNKAGEPLPSWSIFFHFTRVRDWGYWPSTGFIPHSKWWADLCE